MRGTAPGGCNAGGENVLADPVGALLGGDKTGPGFGALAEAAIEPWVFGRVFDAVEGLLLLIRLLENDVSEGTARGAGLRLVRRLSLRPASCAVNASSFPFAYTKPAIGLRSPGLRDRRTGPSLARKNCDEMSRDPSVGERTNVGRAGRFRLCRDGETIDAGLELAGVANGVVSGVDCADEVPGRLRRALERGVTFGLIVATSSIRPILGDMMRRSSLFPSPATLVASFGATYGPCFVRGTVGVVVASCPRKTFFEASPFMMCAPGDRRAVTIPSSRTHCGKLLYSWAPPGFP